MPGLLALSFILLTSLCKSQGNGEVEVTISPNGLNYAAELAVDLLAEEIRSKQFSDVSGSLSLSNIKITEFVKPKAQLQLNPGVGLTANLKDAFIKAEASWKWEKKIGFIKLRENGMVSASSEASISTSVRIGIEDGKPTINAYSCSASVPNFSLQTSGSWTSLIINLLVQLFSGPMRQLIQSKLCDAILSVVNNKGAAKLNTLKLQAQVNEYLTIDYSLPKDPYFSSTFFKSYHKGTFLNDTGASQTPAMNTPTDKMVGMSISENVFNSACRVLHGAGATRYAFNLSNLNEIREVLPFLRGDLAGPYELAIFANAAPTTIISPAGIAVNLHGSLDVTSSPSDRKLMAVTFFLTATATAQVASNALVGSVQRVNLTIVKTEPPAPDGFISDVNAFVRDRVEQQIIQLINKRLASGIALPNLAGVSFSEASLSFEAGYIKTSANVLYSAVVLDKSRVYNGL